MNLASYLNISDLGLDLKLVELAMGAGMAADRTYRFR
jgi:hypothetical protein